MQLRSEQRAAGRPATVHATGIGAGLLEREKTGGCAEAFAQSHPGTNHARSVGKTTDIFAPERSQA